MSHGVEHAGTTDQRSAEEARETLREMCHTLTGLLRESQQPARRVAMAIGAVCIEIEWPTAGPAVAPPAGIALPATVPVNGALVAATAPALNGAEPPDPSADPALTIRSPLVGTFYRATEPGAAPLAAVGDLVEPGQQIGIVEAMKLMNPVEADRRGRVLRILVGDAESVEYDQPLIVLAAPDEEA